MSNDVPKVPLDSGQRRQFLSAIGGVGVMGLLAQTSRGASVAAPPRPIPLGKLGAAGAGVGRPKIAMLVYPKMVLQDLVGPLTVFNLLRAEIHLVWKTLDPVISEVGLPVTPTTRFSACPADLDVLFVPGGLDGTIDAMGDPEVVGFLADRGQRARYVTSDCTGALLLGAAGLLKGYRATSNWVVRDQLDIFGAIPTHDRVVQDRNRITAGGVTAGIDFGLILASLLRDRATAETIQLVIEYAPMPPFSSGTPETAPPAIVERVRAARADIVARARRVGLDVVARRKT